MCCGGAMMRGKGEECHPACLGCGGAMMQGKGEECRPACLGSSADAAGGEPVGIFGPLLGGREQLKTGSSSILVMTANPDF
mmetsp:Transcript_22582/g.45640  ORF Transcript_22582/g.45640 Transcript_22582/m.45640 type:complete len:81 (-) Transcript_22582:40-282(-)